MSTCILARAESACNTPQFPAFAAPQQDSTIGIEGKALGFTTYDVGCIIRRARRLEYQSAHVDDGDVAEIIKRLAAKDWALVESMRKQLEEQHVLNA